MGDVRVSYDGGTSQFDFLTASVGALVESLPLLFLAYIDENEESYIIGVSYRFLLGINFIIQSSSSALYTLSMMQATLLIVT